MIFRNIATRRLTWVPVLAAAFLAGCATKPFNPDEVTVKERVNQRWDALIKSDLDAAYKFASPSYRAITPLDVYRAQFGNAVVWLDAKPLSVDCEPQRCLVRLEIQARHVVRGSKGLEFKSGFDETWVKEDGQWWFVVKR